MYSKKQFPTLDWRNMLRCRLLTALAAYSGMLCRESNICCGKLLASLTP